jgi:hypothetical protein
MKLIDYVVNNKEAILSTIGLTYTYVLAHGGLIPMWKKFIGASENKTKTTLQAPVTTANTKTP